MGMYIPSVPLPDYEWLSSALTERNANAGSAWKCCHDDFVLAYPRGAYALLAAARVVARNTVRPVCFFPSFFCESSLLPLRSAGAEIVFYRVTDTLEPDWQDVRLRAQKNRPDMFVLVHTFGHIQRNDEALSFAQEVGCTVLEDGAHVLKPNAGMGQGKSIVLFSPHKLMPLPPVSFMSIPAIFSDRPRYMFSSGWRRPDWSWLLKRFIQVGFVCAGNHAPDLKKQFCRESVNVVSASNESAATVISKLGCLLVKGMQARLSSVAEIRLRNFSLLAQSLGELPGIEIPLPFREWHHDMVPYVFPFTVKSWNQTDVYHRLRQEGIPVQTWPDLPAMVTSRAEEFPNACKWRSSVLLLPLHQSITPSHIAYMVSGLQYFSAG